MSDLVTYLDKVTAATTVADLWAAHSRAMGSYGFDRLLYGFTRYGGDKGFGDPDDWLILSTQTSEYVDFFLRDGLYQDAPMLQWAFKNQGVCSWRHLTELDANGDLTASQKKVINFNQSMGVTAGYTVSFHSASSRAKGAIALTARAGMTQDDVDALWDIHGREIHMMNNVMHLKLISLPHSGERRLTKRQREVLQWVGDGKSVQCISVLLGLTPATVEKHLRLAREALGVETTPQAVLKAAMYNQMFVTEDS